MLSFHTRNYTSGQEQRHSNLIRPHNCLHSVECEAGVPVGAEDLLDGVDVGGRPEVQPQVVLDAGVHDGLRRPLHGVVEAGVHNVLLGGTRHLLLKGAGRGDGDGTPHPAKPSLQGVLDGLQEVVVGLPLVLEGQPPIGDMVEVLEPFKVGDSDTTSIEVHVRDHEATVVPQDLVSLGRDGTIGSFPNDLCLDFVGIATVDDLLHCCRDQDVTVFKEKFVFVFVRLEIKKYEI